jgi:beta-lactamase regulating signal transducer with metallopeptidase domain
MTDVLAWIAQLTVATSAAILFVLVLRQSLRRHCGADVAYALWGVVPASALGALVMLMASYPNTPPLTQWIVRAELGQKTFVVWSIGAGLTFVLMSIIHLVACWQAKRGQLGPAVVGILAPRVYMPLDAHLIYTPEEIEVIRAHERAHLCRNDPLANALMALGQCLFWFNPLIHMASAAMRIDQEMACDAAVMEERPETRRRYAAAMLKVQMKGAPLVAGCGFMTHPLEERIRVLARAAPFPHPRVIGSMAAGFAAILLVMASVLVFTGRAAEDGPAAMQVQLVRH